MRLAREWCGGQRFDIDVREGASKTKIAGWGRERHTERVKWVSKIEVESTREDGESEEQREQAERRKVL